VKEIGLAAYVDRQLDPGRIPDDRLEASIQAFPALTMNVPSFSTAIPSPIPSSSPRLNRGR